MVNRRVIQLLFLIILCCGCAKKEIRYWKNGSIKSEITYRGGMMNGRAAWYYESGKIQMECYYKDNMLEGKSTRWFENGLKEAECYYKDNKLDGVYITWSMESNIVLDIKSYKAKEENYMNGVLQGPYKVWHPNGQLKIEGFYNNGKFDGKWQYRDENGIKIGEGDFTNGSGKQVAWYINGKKMRETSYKDNMRDGEEAYYCENGSVEKIILYKKDKFINQKIYDNADSR